MIIKYGDAEPISVIEPVDVSDEATKQKLDSLKDTVTAQESADFTLAKTEQEQ